MSNNLYDSDGILSSTYNHITFGSTCDNVTVSSSETRSVETVTLDNFSSVDTIRIITPDSFTEISMTTYRLLMFKERLRTDLRTDHEASSTIVKLNNILDNYLTSKNYKFKKLGEKLFQKVISEYGK